MKIYSQPSVGDLFVDNFLLGTDIVYTTSPKSEILLIPMINR